MKAIKLDSGLCCVLQERDGATRAACPASGGSRRVQKLRELQKCGPDPEGLRVEPDRRGQVHVKVGEFIDSHHP